MAGKIGATALSNIFDMAHTSKDTPDGFLGAIKNLYNSARYYPDVDYMYDLNELLLQYFDIVDGVCDNELYNRIRKEYY